MMMMMNYRCFNGANTNCSSSCITRMNDQLVNAAHAIRHKLTVNKTVCSSVQLTAPVDSQPDTPFCGLSSATISLHCAPDLGMASHLQHKQRIKRFKFNRLTASECCRNTSTCIPCFVCLGGFLTQMKNGMIIMIMISYVEFYVSFRQ